MIGPHAFYDDHPFLHPRSAARTDDEASLPVAEPHPVAITETQLPQHFGMEEGGRPALAGEARRRVVEARIEKRARGCGDQAERPLGIAVVDRRDMVGKRRQPYVLPPDRRPIGAEMKLLVGMGEAVEKM